MACDERSSLLPRRARDDAPGPLDLPRATRYGILLGIWIANFLSALNTTMVATLLASISSDFQKAHQASWLGTAYLLATCTFTPLYGRLCNALGRRAANQTAVALAALGTAACGLSRSMGMLVAARFVAGMGGGGVFTTASIVTCDMYSMRSRGLTQGVAALFESLGMGLGGPFGGFVNDRYGWRWAFLLQLPLFALSLALTSAHLHYATPGRSAGAREVLRTIDWGGSAALLGAVLSFLVFLTARFSDDRPWTAPAVYAPLAASLALAAAFGAVEARWARSPVLPPALARARVPMLVGGASALVSTCNFAVMYSLPTWFQTVLGASAGAAGAHLVPNGVAMSLGSMFAGWYMHRTGRYRALTLVCGILPFVSTVLIASMTPRSHPLLLWMSIFPLGFGNAVVLQTMLIALLSHIPDSALAVGTGFSLLWRGIGQVAGVGLSAAIFQSRLTAELHARLSGPGADALIDEIRHSATRLARLPPDVQAAARAAHAASLRTVFGAAAAATLAAYVVRLPVPDAALDDAPPHSRDKAAPASPALSDGASLAGGGAAAGAHGAAWESEDETLCAAPRRRRLSVAAAAAVALDLPASPIIEVAYVRAHAPRDDPEACPRA